MWVDVHASVCVCVCVCCCAWSINLKAGFPYMSIIFCCISFSFYPSEDLSPTPAVAPVQSSMYPAAAGLASIEVVEIDMVVGVVLFIVVQI